jgi:hypothetical protein
MADEGEPTQPAQQDVKPDVKGEGEHLNLKVKAQVDLLLQLSLPLTMVNAKSSTLLAQQHLTAMSQATTKQVVLLQSHVSPSCRASFSPT